MRDGQVSFLLASFSSSSRWDDNDNIQLFIYALIYSSCSECSPLVRLWDTPMSKKDDGPSSVEFTF